MLHKKDRPTFILSLILVAIFTGSSIFYINTNQKHTSVIPSSKPIHRPNYENLSDQEKPYSSDTATWLTYQTTLFSLKHPPEMTVSLSSARNNIEYQGPTNNYTKEKFFNIDSSDEFQKATSITTRNIDNHLAHIRRIISEDTFHAPSAKAPTITKTQILFENIKFYNSGNLETGSIFLSIYNDGDPEKAKTTSEDIFASIKFKDLDAEKTFTLKAKNLEFQIPNSWWYERNANPESGRDWIQLNTQSNSYPQNGPSFVIGYNPQPNEPILGGYLVDDENRSFFEWTKTTNVTINNVVAKRTESKRNDKIWYNSAFSSSGVIGHLVVDKDQGTYTLTGAITTPAQRKDFDQIISSIKFVQ